jgi:hypothetical protein
MTRSLKQMPKRTSLFISIIVYTSAPEVITMRATLSGLLLAAVASTATAHGNHENHARAHQNQARAATIDTSTLKGKWLYGYQGWFRKPAAGVNNHWSPNGGTPGPGNGTAL